MPPRDTVKELLQKVRNLPLFITVNNFQSVKISFIHEVHSMDYCVAAWVISVKCAK